MILSRVFFDNCCVIFFTATNYLIEELPVVQSKKLIIQILKIYRKVKINISIFKNAVLAPTSQRNRITTFVLNCINIIIDINIVIDIDINIVIDIERENL